MQAHADGAPGAVHAEVRGPTAGTNCIKIGLPGKSILGDYFQDNVTS